MFVCMDLGNIHMPFKCVDKIETTDKVFFPADTLDTQNPIPYIFDSIDELNQYLELANKETLDSLFKRVEHAFRLFVVLEDHSTVILVADIILTYFQDKFGYTHYNILIGDNGSGKNSALLFLSQLGYRVFCVTAPSAANYFTQLGTIEEGQATIAEDEAGDIDQDPDKLRILKSGFRWYCS